MRYAGYSKAMEPAASAWRTKSLQCPGAHPPCTETPTAILTGTQGRDT